MTTVDRLPPHSPEAERGVLGTILIDPKASLPTVVDLQLEEFYDHRHRKIFSTMADLLAGGIPLDLVSLVNRLSAGELAAIGGAAYLNQIVDEVPSAANLGYWVDILREKSAARHVLRTCTEAARRSCDGESPAGIKDYLNLELASVGTGANGATQGLFTESVVSSKDLDAVSLPERKPIVGTFFREGDVGYLFGRRGVGKTLVSLEFCKLAICGGTLNQWHCQGGARILYIDAEMPYAEMAQRIRGFALDGREDFNLLNHEVLFEKERRSLNLADAIQQRAIIDILTSRGCNVMVLDNLSTGLRGVKENDSSDWEPVGQWLLELRCRGIASLVLHHAGRNGEMRGTSKREDPATWIIRLDKDHDNADAAEASVIVRFDKYRSGRTEDAQPFALRFIGKDSIRVETALIDSVDLVVEWVGNGLSSATDIAAEMGLSKGTISKLAKRAIDTGRLVKKGRDYALP